MLIKPNASANAMITGRDMIVERVMPHMVMEKARVTFVRLETSVHILTALHAPWKAIAMGPAVLHLSHRMQSRTPAYAAARINGQGTIAVPALISMEVQIAISAVVITTALRIIRLAKRALSSIIVVGMPAQQRQILERPCANAPALGHGPVGIAIHVQVSMSAMEIIATQGPQCQ